MNKTLQIADFEVANDKPFFLMAGPCQIESLDHAQHICGTMVEICQKLGINYVYKSSFDKANRTSLSGQRGVGLDKGLQILGDVKAEFNVPIVTDIHTEDQCAPVAEVADILQIPASSAGRRIC